MLTATFLWRKRRFPDERSKEELISQRNVTMIWWNINNKEFCQFLCFCFAHSLFGAMYLHILKQWSEDQHKYVHICLSTQHALSQRAVRRINAKEILNAKPAKKPNFVLRVKEPSQSFSRSEGRRTTCEKEKNVSAVFELVLLSQCRREREQKKHTDKVTWGEGERGKLTKNMRRRPRVNPHKSPTKRSRVVPSRWAHSASVCCSCNHISGAIVLSSVTGNASAKREMRRAWRSSSERRILSSWCRRSNEEAELVRLTELRFDDVGRRSDTAQCNTAFEGTCSEESESESGTSIRPCQINRIILFRRPGSRSCNYDLKTNSINLIEVG